MFEWEKVYGFANIFVALNYDFKFRRKKRNLIRINIVCDNNSH